MTSKLVPSDPSKVTVVRRVTQNITTLSAPFARFGRIKVGGRGTIVRMSNGQLAVFSPTALTPEAKAAVTTLGGNVSYIAALDFEHHIFLGPWHQEYPSAQVLGPEGLPEKREAAKNEHVPFAFVFTEKNKKDLRIGPDFDADFDYEYVGGHANKELVFNYRPDRTLIQADLIWNLPATEQYSKTGISADEGLLTKIFSSFQNTAGSAIWQQRFIWYIGAKDRASFKASIGRINGWNFDRIIGCHGDVIETDGQGVFRKLMAWQFDSKRS